MPSTHFTLHYQSRYAHPIPLMILTFDPLQIALLKDFLLYCQFESGIEKVLLWLQEHGLKQIHSFSHINEGQSSIQEQMKSFEQFQEEVKVRSESVERLCSEAGGVDSVITSFKSDLDKKVRSLQVVWDKFSTRLEDRRAVISLATSFYDNVEKV